MKLDGREKQLAAEAIRHVPPSYRWFGRSVPTAEVDEQAGQWDQWKTARVGLQRGDKVWPFLINPSTSAMRAGYVVVRRGEPLSVIVTAVS